MPKTNVPLLAFNRGIVSPSALARVDVDRVRLSAEEMSNWWPKTVGPMSLRPGFEFLGGNINNEKTVDYSFVAATNDTALLEFASNKMRVRVDDQLIVRPAVSTTIQNGLFNGSAGWTLDADDGATATISGGYLRLTALARGSQATASQTVSVATPDVEHALRIVVTRGPVTFRCGSTNGGDEYISETTLRTGSHSLAFTPSSGDFYIHFRNDQRTERLVSTIEVESSGSLTIGTPWDEDHLHLLRFDQSADVVFAACEGVQPHRIERRSTRSWSIVLYSPDSGPFSAGTTSRARLRPTVTEGNGQLLSDSPFFSPQHVGSLFRLFQSGYEITSNLAAEDAYTEAVRVTGIGAENDITVIITGTWSGTLTLQRSYDGPDSGFIDVAANTWTTNGTHTVSTPTEYDNVIIWYRVGFTPGSYTSGNATVEIDYGGGGRYGICRVTGFNGRGNVEMEVLQPFSNTTFTQSWQESVWSGVRGWPSAVALHLGRLWLAGKTRVVGSVSDDYENFDPDFEGDAGPINRTLGSGPVDTINFLLSLKRLIVGTVGSEFSVKSDSLDGPLTPESTQADQPSTEGSRHGVAATRVNNRGLFVQRSGKRVMELLFDPNSYDYLPSDLMLLAPDLFGDAVAVGMTVQRQPDTRIYVWLDNGRVAAITYEPSEKVACWHYIDVGGEGFVENIAILPGDVEDRVYFRVRREIDSQTKRSLEKMAMESECLGETINKQADSFTVYSGAATNTITGLDFWEGSEFIVWADGKDLSPDIDGVQRTYTVNGGQIVLDEDVSNAVVGFPYSARYKSTKLAYAAGAGTALTQKKRVNYIGVILGTTHNHGLQYGRDFDNLDPLPRTIDGRPVTSDEIFEEYDQPAVTFDGSWDTDSRMCLLAKAPRPCNLMATVITVETHDKA